MGAGHIAGARLIRMSASLAFQVGAARVLGPAGYGLLSHALSGAAVGQQAIDVGTSAATGVEVARGRSLGSWEVVRRAVRRGAMAKAVLALAFLGIVVFFPRSGEWLLGARMVHWGVLLCVAAGMVGLLEYVAVGMGLVTRLHLIAVFGYALPAGTALAAVWMVGSPEAGVAGLAVATGLGALGLGWVLVRELPRAYGMLGAVEEGATVSFGLSALQLGLVAFGGAFVFRAPIIALGAGGDAVATGILGAGVAIMERAALVGTALGLAAGPELSGWVSGGPQAPRALEVVRTSARVAFWTTVSVAVVGPLAVVLLFGERFVLVGTLFPLLMPALYLQANMQTLGGLLDFGGWARERAIAWSAAATFVALGVVLARGTLGAHGGAALVGLGLVIVYATILLQSFGHPGGALIRGALWIVGADGLRLGTVLLPVWVLRAARPDLDPWIDVALTLGVALVAAAIVVRVVPRGRQ